MFRRQLHYEFIVLASVAQEDRHDKDTKSAAFKRHFPSRSMSLPFSHNMRIIGEGFEAGPGRG